MASSKIIPRKRSDTSTTTSSATSTSRKGSQYWDNLMCLFVGLQPNRPAATSTNNEDFFPSPQSSVAKDSSSPQEKALPNSEPSRSSVRSMSLRGSSERRSQSQSSAIRRVRRCNVQNGSVISNESPSLNLIPEPGCFDIKTPRSRDVDRSLEGPSGASEPKVIAVERDGQTYWIPESILKQFSATKSRDLLAQAQNEDGCVGKPTKPSDMRISIPKRAGSSQLRCSSESSSLDLTNGSSPPSSVPSSAFSSSTCSRETPRTSLEPLTPTEAPFSHCLPSPDHWLTANPATSRLIQEDTPEAAPKDARSIYFPPPLQPRNPARIHASTPGRSTMSSTEQLRENEHRVESSSLLDNSRNDMNLHSCSVGAQDLPKQSRGRQWARRLSFGGKSRRRSYGQLSKEVYLQKDLPAIPNLEKKDSSLNFKSATIGQEPKHHSGIGNDQPQDGLISSNAAEAVILGILNSTESLEDLFAAARVNRGFYSLFDRNKLALFKCALYNGSRPTWEFMEIESQKTRTALHRSGICSTANTYLQTVKQHNCILTALKGMVFEQCHSWLRSETVKGLTGLKISKSADVDKALWRIWTFCTLFGPKTGRDNDMAGQLDWLRGGQVASRTLQNIPRSFAQSNFGGLTLDELFDMLEMWSCIQTLLSSMQGIHMRYTARQYGIFDGHDIKEGDESQEQFVLDEWVHYLCAQGLSTVLDLANAIQTGVTSAFMLASSMGWTTWQQPPPAHASSRSGFLKDAISHVYEEQVALQQITQPHVPSEGTQARRQYQRRLALELKKTKLTMDPDSVPFSQERPMSVSSFPEPIPSGSSAPSTLLTASSLRFESPVEPAAPDESHIHPALRRYSRAGSHEALPLSGLSPTSSSNDASDPNSNTSLCTSSGPTIPLSSPAATPSLQREPTIPIKSADRLATVQLVSLGWKPNEARQALKATAIDPADAAAIAGGPAESKRDATVERAVAWLTTKRHGVV